MLLAPTALLIAPGGLFGRFLRVELPFPSDPSPRGFLNQEGCRQGSRGRAPLSDLYNP